MSSSHSTKSVADAAGVSPDLVRIYVLAAVEAALAAGLPRHVVRRDQIRGLVPAAIANPNIRNQHDFAAAVVRSMS